MKRRTFVSQLSAVLGLSLVSNSAPLASEDSTKKKPVMIPTGIEGLSFQKSEDHIFRFVFRNKQWNQYLTQEGIDNYKNTVKRYLDSGDLKLIKQANRVIPYSHDNQKRYILYRRILIFKDVPSRISFVDEFHRIINENLIAKKSELA